MPIDDCMSVLSKVFTVVKITKQIYDIVEDVKSFKAKSKTLAKNVKVIVRPVTVLKEKCTEEELERYRDSSGAGSGDGTETKLDENGVEPIWISSLCELQLCLEEVESFLKKLSSKNQFEKALKKRKIQDKFESFNSKLLMLGQNLILSLQVDFKDLITEEMVKDMKDICCTLHILTNKVEENKQGVDKIEKVAAETNDMVKELIFERQLKVPTEKEGHMKYSDFSEVEKLHEGTYGPIFKAKHNCENKMLVVKQFEDRGLSARKELKEQCELWKQLNFSPSIVHLYGYTVDEVGHMCFVVEYMPYGDLRSVLLDRDSHPLSWKQKKVLAKGCALGLCAIHCGQGKTMLHRAITSTRFMVDENYTAKISDNGFVKSASKISKSSALSSGDRGSVERDETNYLCPEETMSDGNKRTVKSEIYKLGVIFYEIASRKKPFQAMEETDGKPLETVKKYNFIKDGRTEPPPEDTPADFRDLINSCRQKDPSKRPSTYDIVRSLEKMYFSELETPVDA